MSLTNKVKKGIATGLVASTLALSQGCSSSDRPSLSPVSAVFTGLRLLYKLDQATRNQQTENQNAQSRRRGNK